MDSGIIINIIFLYFLGWIDQDRIPRGQHPAGHPASWIPHPGGALYIQEH